MGQSSRMADDQLHKPGHSRQHEVNVQYCTCGKRCGEGFADHYLRSGLGGMPAQGGVRTVIAGRAMDRVCITRGGTQGGTRWIWWLHVECRARALDTVFGHMVVIQENSTVCVQPLRWATCLIMVRSLEWINKIALYKPLWRKLVWFLDIIFALGNSGKFPEASLSVGGKV